MAIKYAIEYFGDKALFDHKVLHVERTVCAPAKADESITSNRVDKAILN